MKRTKFIWAYILVLLFCVLPFSAQAQSQAVQGNPVELLKYIADNMLSQLKSNKATLQTKPKIVYGIAYKYVVPYADLNEMSRRVLPPKIWRAASKDQRLKFQKEFTTLLVRTYSSALSSYKDQTVRFFPVRGGYQGKKKVVVNSSIISSSAQPLNVSYRLVRTGSVWRLYDMSVEGVSMLQSFRSQFSSILAQGNMDQLINKLGKHNDR